MFAAQFRDEAGLSVGTEAPLILGEVEENGREFSRDGVKVRRPFSRGMEADFSNTLISHFLVFVVKSCVEGVIDCANCWIDLPGVLEDLGASQGPCQWRIEL